jgi:PKD repeat protein
MRITYILILVFVILALSGCKKEDEDDLANITTLTLPIASFSYTGNDQPSPATIQFTNTSEYADVFAWDFGDGGSSTEVNPTHIYFNSSDKPKSFLVKLTATDTYSEKSNTRSRSITILPGK